MTSKPLKVIIAGGSVAGLSLALMLEKNGIDFVVLEAYPDIAPQVGASIGVLPNGLHILDQLGCCDQVIGMAEYPVEKVFFRDSSGRPFCHGYPVVFLDRRMLIQILYDKVEDKSKVLTSERVVTVENTISHVTVTTKTGNSYTGDIVVGADGIHSTVRKKMWQEAQQTDPTWIDPLEALPATYACIFGISKGVPGIEKGTLSSVFNEHFSYLIPSGPGDRTYWFLVRNLGKKVYGRDIPRFTKQEEEALAKEHWDDYVTPTVRLPDLYEHKISSVYTSLPEYVYKKWYFRRIMTIGDASHKFEPLTGQGGNSAIETAASLANHLTSALNANASQPLSTEDISSIFEQVQQQQQDRVWGLVKSSHTRQRLECMETPALKFIAKYIFPHIPKQVVMDRWIRTYCPAVSLYMLPQPDRPRKIPFHDELLRTPVSRGLLGPALYAGYIILAWLAFRLLFVAGKENGTWALIRDAVIQRAIPGMDVPLRQDYTGVQSVDRIMQVVVTMFFSTVTSPSPQQVVQIVYFLSTVLPVVAIFTVEGFRPRNKWTLLAFPSLWATLCQLRGIGFIAPLYFLTSAFISRSIEYYSSASMALSVTTAKAILPAVIAGYIIPSMLLFFPYSSADTHQDIIAFWQAAPVLAPILTGTFSYLLKLRVRKCNNDPSKGMKDTYLPYLDTVYKATGAISACFHAFVVVGCMVSDDIPLTDILLPKDSFAPVSSLADGVFIFFQNDCLMTAMAVFLCCTVTIWDLYRVGLSNATLLSGLGAVAVGFGLVGPGATATAVWYWREHSLGGSRS